MFSLPSSLPKIHPTDLSVLLFYYCHDLVAVVVSIDAATTSTRYCIILILILTAIAVLHVRILLHIYIYFAATLYALFHVKESM